MNLGIRESVALARGVLQELRGVEHAPQVVVCPPFTAMSEVRKVFLRSRLAMGAQNCGFDRSGAYTGEISVAMLEDLACEYVLLGHSERRHVFAEPEDIIRKKMATAYESKLIPVLCVGETEAERGERGKEYVLGQLASALEGVRAERNKPVIVAYEPVWAIGTGEAASVADVIEMHAFIRAEAIRLTHAEEEGVVVLYGGSVSEENAYQLLREPEVDGLLVGGASIKLQTFKGILRAGIEVAEAQK